MVEKNWMKKYKYPFEKLDVWQNARKLTIEVYKITNDFPKYELFGLTNQINRSVISVSSNIAEGSGRKSKKDQANFTTIAYSSLLELTNQPFNLSTYKPLHLSTLSPESAGGPGFLFIDFPDKINNRIN